MSARMAVLVLVAGTALAPRPLHAQRFMVAGEVFNAQHRVLFQGAVGERSGMFLGGSAGVRIGPVTLRLGMLTGSLAAGDDSAVAKTSVRSSSLRIAIQPRPWVEAGVEAEARRFDSDVGLTIWKLLGATVRLTPPMGVAGLAGLVEVSLFPSASVTTGESLSPAMRGTAGVAYASPRGVVGFSLGYRFERFDFPGSGTGARLEQFRGVVAGVTLRR